jgi:transglutaminase-like putative cysteine protease
VKARAFAGLFAVALAVSVAAIPSAGARSPEPTVHEPIPPDAREDLAMHVTVSGLPGVIETRSGLVSAPDPLRAPSSRETAYGADTARSYTPDRDTRRPELTPYDDPFTPATAPFKRLQAFDSVGADYKLHVSDQRMATLPLQGEAQPRDDIFYGDLVVSITPGQSTRIPSVGPGAHILRASLGDGVDVLTSYRVAHDGAENWFLEVPGVSRPLRARLVIELGAPRAAFGGPLADVTWDRLPPVLPLPPNVAQDAAQVRAAIGVGHDMRPRDAIAKMVAYFRAFEVSDDPPTGHGNVYLDLALTKKGVCRHRSFAFLVTALGLGIPTRFVMNETHAWVEVNDGTLWKRIDLGGAGHMASKDRSEEDTPPYEAPSDAFPWPRASERGEDMVREAREGGGSAPSTRGRSSSSTPAPAPSAEHGTTEGKLSGATERGVSAIAVTLASVDAEPHRGQALHVSGEVRSEGQPCPHAAVEVWLRHPKTEEKIRLGTLATGDDGKFAGSVVVPQTAALGPYDVVAQTPNE